MEGIPYAGVGVILSGLLVGIAFGYVLQRGRYWMNTAFRDVIFINDYTLFRAWLLALLIAIIGSNLIEEIGLVGEGLRRQSFAPISAIVGGYIFGLGIVMAGGCGSGVLYKQGEGQFAATVATFGFGASLIATYHGPLKPVMQYLKGYKVTLGSGDDEISSPALWDLIGGGTSIKWIVIAVVAAIIIPVVIKGKPFGKQPKKGWSWSLGGAVVGLMVIIAWWASYYFGGQARGLSFSGPLIDLLMFLLTGSSQAPFDPMFNFLGIGVLTWSALYVIGVPLGAHLSARGLKEYKLTTPRDANELVRVFLGGMVMGFGAATAGGWTVGHSLTGMSGLALQSIVATVFIILGNWTMAYFMFIKPMKDME